MLVVTKLVNVHFSIGGRKVKWAFQTTYDSLADTKQYSITTTNRMEYVNKERGNKIFQFIKSHFAGCKIVVIIDCDGTDSVQYIRVMDHYEIRVGGKFAESCEASEVRSCVAKWKQVVSN